MRDRSNIDGKRYRITVIQNETITKNGQQLVAYRARVVFIRHGQQYQVISAALGWDVRVTQVGIQRQAEDGRRLSGGCVARVRRRFDLQQGQPIRVFLSARDLVI
jgi:hypothetical protein